MDFIKNIVNKFAFAFAFLFIMILGCQKKNNVSDTEPINYVGFVNEVIEKYIEEVKKEFGFKCAGIGGAMSLDVQEISIHFRAYRKATINEARELEVKLIEKLKNIVDSHEKLRPYLREYPFPSEGAGILIGFYDRNNQRQYKNSISRMMQVRNKLFFDIYDPEKDTCINIKEENYEDSLEIVGRNLKMKNQSL